LNNPEVGGKVLLSFESSLSKMGLATVTLENSDTVTIPQYVMSQSQDQNTRILQINIPPGIPPGRYRVYLKALFEINPIRKVVGTFQSEEFEV